MNEMKSHLEELVKSLLEKHKSTSGTGNKETIDISPLMDAEKTKYGIFTIRSSW